MQIEAELQVLDEPVKPVDSTGLTAQTGLTGPETGLTPSHQKTPIQPWKGPKIKIGEFL